MLHLEILVENGIILVDSDNQNFKTPNLFY